MPYLHLDCIYLNKNTNISAWRLTDEEYLILNNGKYSVVTPEEFSEIAD